MILRKDHKRRVVEKGGVRVGLKKTFGKECFATQSSTMTPKDVAALKSKIEKGVLAKVTVLLQKIGLPDIDWLCIKQEQNYKHTFVF